MSAEEIKKYKSSKAYIWVKNLNRAAGYDTEEKMIDDAVLCERWGEDLRYKFSDGSSLLYRSVVDEYVL